MWLLLPWRVSVTMTYRGSSAAAPQNEGLVCSSTVMSLSSSTPIMRQMRGANPLFRTTPQQVCNTAFSDRLMNCCIPQLHHNTERSDATVPRTRRTHLRLMARRLLACHIGRTGLEAVSAFLMCACMAAIGSMCCLSAELVLSPVSRRHSCARGGVCVRHCRTAFMKQVLPRLTRPEPCGRATGGCGAGTQGQTAHRGPVRRADLAAGSSPPAAAAANAVVVLAAQG